jgi:predicted amidophosphoribosyltransferase
MRMKSFLSSFFQSFHSFLFPPFCLACSSPLEEKRKTLCSTCFSSLKLLSPDARCPQCFQPLFDEKCSWCLKEPYPLQAMGVCFEENRPLQALTSFLTEQKDVSSLSSFCIIKLEELAFPSFDMIIPTPGDWFSYGEDRYKTRKLLAKEIAHLLQCEYKELFLDRAFMKNPYGSLEEDESVETPVFIKDPESFKNQRILLVHDTWKTGRAFCHTQKAFSSYGIDRVYGLSLMTSS